ncbi:hypothetical protein THAOC_24505, partial [Thalassiosira oceanica]
MHQRVFRYQSRPFYVPGESNGMADDCSRLWHLSDSDLVSYFNATYPQPKPWRLCHLEPGTASALFSALRCKRQPLPDTLAGAKSENTRAHGGPPRTGRGSWQLAVNPSAHGLRKRLFNSLGKRCRSWASGTNGLTSLPTRYAGRSAGALHPRQKTATQRRSASSTGGEVLTGDSRIGDLVTTATQRGSASSTPSLRLTTVDSRLGDAEGGAALTGDIRRGDLADEAAQRG